jgi:ribonuclease-3 family protein
MVPPLGRHGESAAWDAAQVPALALAFMGDAVWSAYARNHVLSQGIRRPQALHRAATRYVSAAAQARAAQWLEAHLTEEELAVLRRGRNAKPGHGHRGGDVLTYRRSTGFEALLGYLYGSGQWDRLDEICRAVLAFLDGQEGHEGDA